MPLNGTEYNIRKLLGKGKGGYSYLADDREQVRQMCALLYDAHLNIDYFPTNFVAQNGELFYIDYECNDYMDEWNFENWGIKYWSKTPGFLQYVKEH